jgi:D-glycero-D-manno-heptose 1,7-bisphosphate phosphatase
MEADPRQPRSDREAGGRIDGIEFAPEHPDEASHKRKPSPGMLKDLARRLQVNLDEVPFVGDSASDIDAARAAGARPVLVRTGKGRRTEGARQSDDDVAIYDDLASFATALIAAH